MLAVSRGWFVFGAPYRTKKTYFRSHGNKDAKSGTTALTVWETRPDANPCIRLDWSGLTVLDIDHGLHTIEEVRAWATRNNLSTGYIVASGRASGGFHLYYKGVRTLPDVLQKPKLGRFGFTLDDAQGDIKCHGHVVAEGGFHQVRPYTAYGRVEDIAPLPDRIRDYRDPKDVELEAKQLAKAAKRIARDIDAPTTKVLEKNRHDWLMQQAGRLRREYGFGFDALYTGLLDLVQHCENSSDKTDDELRSIAKHCSEQPTPFRFISRSGTILRKAPQANLAQKEDEICRTLVEVCKMGELMTIDTIMERITPILQYEPSNGTLHRAMKRANFEKAGAVPEDRRKTLWIRRGELKGKKLDTDLG